MIKKIIFIILLIYSFKGASQEFSVLEIKDSSFYKILDSVLVFEKKCDYYHSDLLFSINIQYFNDTSYFIMIQSFGKIAYNDDRTNFGCFKYGKHLFFVKGEKVGLMPEILFTKTDKKQKVKITKRPKGDLIILDDSWTIWAYWYINKKFIFESRGSACEKNNSAEE